MPAKQKQRQISVSTPLQQDLLVFYRMNGSEELGRLFKYELDLLSSDANINLDDVLGKPLTVELAMANNKKRYFNGYASNFRYMGILETHHVYKATLRPWLWFLTRSADCRIFQNKTVPDIIKEIFRDFGYSEFEDNLSDTYKQWEYCVQYRETAFNFVSRLMEQEGIYYYFKHTQNTHTLVLADSISAHSSISGYEQIPYYPPQQQERREGEYVDDWFVSKGIEPQSYTLSDFDFTKPRSSMEVREFVEDGYPDFEIFDYPGEYTDLEAGRAAARARAEQLETHYERTNAKGNVRALSAGSLFELTNYPRGAQNKEYLLLSARYYLHSDLYRSTKNAASLPDYRIVFSAMDSAHSFRPAPITPQPTVKGPQTAIVVGPEGEKVWVDQYGRIKVQFHWDRYGQQDENSSCWIRVSQAWAGKNWGGMHIPHIGEEVIVEFLEGDPDRPIVTGRVYNADNMPALDQPKNKLKSIIRDDFGNEMVFDATPGDEHIRLYSPHHNSGLELGKSYNVLTTSDDNSGKLGNSFEWGFGTKTEIYGGMATEVKGGLLSEVKLGTMLDFKWGGEASVNWTWENKTVQGPIHEYTKKDILSLSGEDHVLGAGKGLCLVGNSRGLHDARTVINLEEQSVSITAGPAQVQNVANANARFGANEQLFKDLYPDDEKWRKIMMHTVVAMAVIGAAGGSLVGGIAHPFVGEPKEGESMNINWTHILSIVLGSLGALGGLFVGVPGTKKLKEMWKKDTAVEPVKHSDPTAKIEVHKNKGVNVETKGKRINIECDKSAVWISEKTGNIIITTSDTTKTGDIQLFSKGDIVLDAKSNKIRLQATEIWGGRATVKFKNLMAD